MYTRMVRCLRRHTSFANVAALLALFVALGGSSFAAPARDAASGVAADVKRALKLGKQADARSRLALTEARKAAAKAGPQGAAGPQGPAGEPGPTGAAGQRGIAGEKGTGLGYAQIEYCPTGPATGGVPCEDYSGGPGWFSSDDTNSPGIDNSVNFTTPSPTTGVFCYHDLPFTPHVVVATAMTVGDPTAAPATHAYVVQGRAGSEQHPLDECGYGTPGVNDDRTAAVYVRDAADGGLVEPDQSMRIGVVFA